MHANDAIVARNGLKQQPILSTSTCVLGPKTHLHALGWWLAASIFVHV
jgi:hypothetical protein